MAGSPRGPGVSRTRTIWSRPRCCERSAPCRTSSPGARGPSWPYLRTILLNQLRTAVQRANAGPPLQSLPETLEGARPSPVEEAIGAEAIEAYEAALAGLTEDQRQAVVLRIELGMSFQEVAEATESPSADAARMLVARGLARSEERRVGKE